MLNAGNYFVILIKIIHYNVHYASFDILSYIISSEWDNAWKKIEIKIKHFVTSS